MSFVLFTEDFPPDFYGGVSAWAHDLALALAPYGLKVYARNTPNAKRFDSHFPVDISRIKGRNWGRFKSIWTWVSGRNIQAKTAIFAHWQLARHAAKALQKKGINVWVYAHGSDINIKSIDVNALKKTAQSIDLWLPVSKSLENRLHSILQAPNTTVPPMPIHIPDNPRSPTLDGPLMVVSRLVESKGIDKAIGLADRLGKPLEIIGDGPDKMRLEHLARSKDVTFHGQRTREECLQHIESASGIVLLSTCNRNQIGDEGFGLCLLEAASRARGTIGSHSGGIPEAIGPGILLPPKITSFHLDKINTRLNDPNWGMECYNWVKENHGAELCAQTLNQLQ